MTSWGPFKSYNPMINAQSSLIQNNLDMQQSSSKYGNFKGNLTIKKKTKTVAEGRQPRMAFAATVWVRGMDMSPTGSSVTSSAECYTHIVQCTVHRITAPFSESASDLW